MIIVVYLEDGIHFFFSLSFFAYLFIAVRLHLHSVLLTITQRFPLIVLFILFPLDNIIRGRRTVPIVVVVPPFEHIVERDTRVV